MHTRRLFAERSLPILLGAYAAATAVMPSPAWRIAAAAPLAILPAVWWTLRSPGRWISLFIASALLLPPLGLPLGDSGPHPAIAFAAIGVLCGITRAGEWRFAIDSLTASIAAFFVVLLGSVAAAAVYSGGEVAAATLARVLLFGISVYVFIYAAHGPSRTEPTGGTVSWILAAGTAAAAFACIDFYFQFPAPAGFGPQFIWLEAGVFRRAQGLFYEASTLGNFCAFLLVMIGVAAVQPREHRLVRRRWLLAAALVSGAALVLSYSRASLLNVAVAFAALAWLRRVRLARLIIAGMVAVTAAALAVYAVVPAVATGYWMRLGATLQYFWSAPEAVLSGRVASWRMLLEFLADAPWHAIAGIGYKTLPYSDFAGRPVVADNMYLSLLVETGLIGLAVFVFMNIAILRTGLTAARSDTPRTAFFGTWIFCFWAGQMVQMLSGDLMTYWRVLPLYFWVLAAAWRGART